MNPFTTVATLMALNGVRQTSMSDTIKSNSGYDNLQPIQPFEDLVNIIKLPLINIDELSSDELHNLAQKSLRKLFTD